jgi:hypothetical protein
VGVVRSRQLDSCKCLKTIAGTSGIVRNRAVTMPDSNQVRRFPCLPEVDSLHTKPTATRLQKHRAHARFVLPEIAAEVKHHATRRPTESLPPILVPDRRNRVLLNEDTPTNGPPHLAGPERGQLAAFTHLMDDANVVPETERSRYPW